MNSIEPGPPHGWRTAAFTEVRDRLASCAVVAVDGRSSGGKTSFAARLTAAVPGSVVVHTDDIAWHHSVFDWAELLAQGVLVPFRAGSAVAFRPPQWEARDRPGAIEVPVGTPLLIVEGVGSARRALAAHYDAVVWVQSDRELTARRDAVRLAAGEMTAADFDSWMAEELPFQERERTWERADLIVAGAPVLPFDPEREIVVAA